MTITIYPAAYSSQKEPYADAEKSVLVIGGDHPYTQWWGNDGRDGLYQMHEDLDIKPYIAICADESTDATSGNGATMKIQDLVFETVGCCETHVQAKVEKDGLRYCITPCDDLYNVAVYGDNGLVSRHNRINAVELEKMV